MSGCADEGEPDDQSRTTRILIVAAITSVQKALAMLGESLETGTAIDRPDLLMSFGEINSIMGLPFLRELEDRHLLPADRERKYGKAK
jgi:hypothetical protein